MTESNHSPGRMAVVRDGPRILLIDDDEEHAEIVAAILAHQGYTLDLAHEGASGILRALACPPGLIVLDHYMPILDGFAAAERLRADARTMSVPILFLSACGEAATRLRGLGFANADYLAKPFHAAELLARVARMLRPRSPIETPWPVPT